MHADWYIHDWQHFIPPPGDRRMLCPHVVTASDVSVLVFPSAMQSPRSVFASCTAGLGGWGASYCPIFREGKQGAWHCGTEQTCSLVQGRQCPYNPHYLQQRHAARLYDNHKNNDFYQTLMKIIVHVKILYERL